MGGTFLLIGYYNKHGANSTCARNIAAELVKRGNRVVVLSDLAQDYPKHGTDDGVEVYRIKASLIERIQRKAEKYDNSAIRKLFRLLFFFRSIIAAIFYPNIEPIHSARVYYAAKKLHDIYRFDGVVAFYRPYDSIRASILLKKKYHSALKIVTYHLDLLSSPSNANKHVVKYKIKRAASAFDRELCLCDKVLLPNSARERIETSNEIIAFLDFPLFVSQDAKQQCCKFTFPENTINLAYAGLLGDGNRNPLQFISALEKLPKIRNRKVILHIWGGLEGKETVAAVQNSSVVVYHGIAESGEVPGILASADFLLNISNKIVYQMVPSKIFQLFAANKPIINVVQHENDAALPYFERTSCTLNLKAYEDGIDAPGLIKDFIDRNYGAEVRNQEELFIESTPEYAVDLIEKAIGAK